MSIVLDFGKRADGGTQMFVLSSRVISLLFLSNVSTSHKDDCPYVIYI